MRNCMPRMHACACHSIKNEDKKIDENFAKHGEIHYI